MSSLTGNLVRFGGTTKFRSFTLGASSSVDEGYSCDVLVMSVKKTNDNPEANSELTALFPDGIVKTFYVTYHELRLAMVIA